MSKIRINELLNYKEICKEMNDIVKSGGKYRNLQLRNWQQEYDIEKINKKYIIKGKLDGYSKQIVESHGKFTTYIENLLIWLIDNKKEDKYDVRLGYRELFEYMNIVNKEYYPTKYSSKKQQEYLLDFSSSKKLEFSSLNNDLNIFFDTSYRLLKRMIKDSLNFMEERSLIIYSKAFRFYKEIYIKETNQTIFESHDCTDEEMSCVLGFYGYVMDKFNVKDDSEIFLLNPVLKKEFYRQIDDLIKKEYGYDSHCETFKIIVASNIKSKIDPIQGMKSLNNNVKNKMSKSKELNNKIPKNILDSFIKDFIEI